MCRTVVVGRLRRAGAAPFAVKNAVIVDQDGRKVKLWGVNDLAPFNHNFVNIRQAGVDLKTAIDTVGCRRWLGIGFSIAHCFVTANGSW